MITQDEFSSYFNNSAQYFYKKSMGASEENLCFDIGVNGLTYLAFEVIP